MISTKSFIKCIVIIVTIIMLEYLSLFTSVNMTNLRIAVGIIGVLLSLFLLFKKKEGDNNYLLISRYFKIYIPIIIFFVIYTSFIYNYTLKDTLISLSQYLYVFYAFPIVYIFSKDKNVDKLLTIICTLTTIILLFKTISWYFYNYKGIVLFENLLFRYSEGWIRNGLKRVSDGYLIDVLFSFSLYNIIRSRKKITSYGVIAFVMIFTLFISQWRIKFIIMIFVLITYFLVSSKNVISKFLKSYFVISFVMLFLVLGGYEIFTNQFSATGNYSGSTNYRIETLHHFSNIIKSQKRVFGLGLLTMSNENVASICYKDNYQNYWIEDLGIVGGIFRFGVFSIFIYGYIFYISLMILYKKSKESFNPENVFLIVLIVYTLLNCITYNFFDQQFSFGLPFYLAILSFYCSNISKKSIE